MPGDQEQPDFQIVSPGRLCLIGEHVDYAGGRSIGVATSLATRFLCYQRPQAALTLRSDRFESRYDDSVPNTYKDWRRYIQSYCKLSGFKPKGWHIDIKSDLPDGAGLSSSASLLVAMGLFHHTVEGATPDLMELARFAQRVENEGIGVGCGLLDQLSILFAKEHHVVSIRFDQPSASPIPFPSQMGRFIVIHTGIRRELGGSGYNDRPKECAEALSLLQQSHPALSFLAQATEEEALSLPSPLKERALHVIQEVRRVDQALAALEEEDAVGLGRLLNETHQSLSHLFQVSLKPIDNLVKALQEHPEVLGARLMGGGFGGSVLVLAPPDADEELQVELMELAEEIEGVTPRAWLLDAAPGARVIKG